MNGPDKAAWSNTSGVHTLTVTGAVTHLPQAKPEAVAAQIHDTHDDVLQIRLEGTRLLAQYDDGARQVELDPNYTLGTRYNLNITAADQRVQVNYNDAKKVDLPLSGSGWYFKTGAYVQSSTSTGDQPPANAQVVVYSLAATHTDPDRLARASTSTPTAASGQPNPTPADADGAAPGVRCRVSELGRRL
jgi:Alginate lyase